MGTGTVYCGFRTFWWCVYGKFEVAGELSEVVGSFGGCARGNRGQFVCTSELLSISISIRWLAGNMGEPFLLSSCRVRVCLSSV